MGAGESVAVNDVGLSTASTSHAPLYLTTVTFFTITSWPTKKKCGVDVVNVAVVPEIVAVVTFAELLLQCSPPPQNVAQSPQFELSMRGSMQVFCTSHVDGFAVVEHGAHTPAEHAPLAHTLPQVPQLFGSVFVFVHVPKHAVGVAGVALQFATHVPAEQTSLPWHGPALLHDVPHVVGSVRSTQVPLQFTVPIAQHLPFALYSLTASQQRPVMQFSVAAQSLPQLPQFASSVWVFVQLVPLQLSSFVPQHSPPSHVVPVPQA